MRGPPGGVRAAEPNSPRGAGGGRAPLGLELRPWEGNPHSPRAPGGGGERRRRAPPPTAGAGLQARSPGEGYPDPCGLLPGLPVPPALPSDGFAAADRTQPSPCVVRDLA